MPFGFAVITKGRSAARPFTGDLWARGAPGSDDCIGTVWGGTPSGVRIGSQDSTQHQRLVQCQQITILIAEQILDVVGMHGFSALRTAKIDSALLDLNPNIDLEALQAE